MPSTLEIIVFLISSAVLVVFLSTLEQIHDDRAKKKRKDRGEW